MGHQHVQHFGCQLAGRAHAGETGFVVDDNGALFEVEVCHAGPVRFWAWI